MKTLLKNIERVAVILGVAASFLAVLEILQAYETLDRIHPWVGYAFLGIVALLIAYLVYQVRLIFRFSRVPTIPNVEDHGRLTRRERQQILRFLNIIRTRFCQNQVLKNETENQLSELADAIQDLEKSGKTNEDFLQQFTSIEKNQIAPLIMVLDKQAEIVVSRQVGMVSLGSALSPYRSLDLYIVLNRNFRMITEIIRIYRSRPSVRETIAIFYDISRTLAAVNLLNSIDTLWMGISKHFPSWVGKLGEHLSEGLFSGLLTSITGHAAIDRCRTYQPWSAEEAARKYRGKLERWGRDIVKSLLREPFNWKNWKKKPANDGDDEHSQDPEETLHESHENDPGTRLSRFNLFKRRK